MLKSVHRSKIFQLTILVLLIGIMATGCTAAAVTTTPAVTATTTAPTKTVATTTKGTAKESIVLRFAHGSPETTAYHQSIVKFKEMVEKRSNGRLIIEIYPNGTIPSEQEQVRLGTVEMSIGTAGTLLDYDPRWAIMDLPFFFLNFEQVDKVFDGDLLEKLGMYGEIPKSNIVVLPGFFENGFRNLTNSIRPVTKPSDMKGIKIRTMKSPLHQDIWSSIGATPTFIAFEELYSSLQTHIVDAQENPIETICKMKFYEVQKYLTETQHLYYGMPTFINAAVYKKLSPDLQEILRQANKEAAAIQKIASRKENESNRQVLVDHGVNITTLTAEQKLAFAEATKKIYDNYADKIGKDLINKFLSEMGRKPMY